jgi:hypothetical protein
MFSLWDDFTLGLAGVGDLLGITSGAAAETWANQEADARGLDAIARLDLVDAATEADKREGIVRKAADKTAEQVGETVAGFASWVKWTALGLGAAVLGLAALVYLPKPARAAA